MVPTILFIFGKYWVPGSLQTLGTWRTIIIKLMFQLFFRTRYLSLEFKKIWKKMTKQKIRRDLNV